MEAMTRETKLGLLLALCLVMGVGIVVCDLLDKTPRPDGDLSMIEEETEPLRDGGQSVGGNRLVPGRVDQRPPMDNVDLSGGGDTGNATAERVLPVIKQAVTSLRGNLDTLLDETLGTGVSGTIEGQREAIVIEDTKPRDVKYRVKKGESLWRIADKFYGNGSKYKLIIKANPRKIKGESVGAGVEIVIPGIKSPGQSQDGARTAIKRSGAGRHPMAVDMIAKFEKKTGRMLKHKEILMVERFVSSYKTLVNQYGGRNNIPLQDQLVMQNQFMSLRDDVLAVMAPVTRASGVLNFEVNTPGNNTTGTSAQSSRKKQHTVARGELLWHISQKYLGHGKNWRKIRDANKGKVSTSGQVKEGVVLEIPLARG